MIVPSRSGDVAPAALSASASHARTLAEVSTSTGSAGQLVPVLSMIIFLPRAYLPTSRNPRDFITG